MTLPIPVLDDLAWTELVIESRESLPSTAPGWTDHNVHDPGITIVELLAWLTEHTCYRLDQIPPAHRARFLSLLGGMPPGEPDGDEVDRSIAAAARALHAHEVLVELAVAHDADSLDDIDRSVVDATEVPARAVTTLDLERVVLATPGHDVARVRAFAGLDLAVPCWRAPGTVSMVVVTPTPSVRPHATPEVLAAVRAWAGARKTVGTRLRVHGPRYTPVSMRLEISVRERADRNRVVAAVERAVRRFLHPLEGGPDGRGWPFGRDVYRSEILALASDVTGVDLATDVQLGYGDRDTNTGCANLCVPAVDLVDLVDLVVEVAT